LREPLLPDAYIRGKATRVSGVYGCGNAVRLPWAFSRGADRPGWFPRRRASSLVRKGIHGRRTRVVPSGPWLDEVRRGVKPRKSGFKRILRFRFAESVFMRRKNPARVPGSSFREPLSDSVMASASSFASKVARSDDGLIEAARAGTKARRQETESGPEQRSRMADKDGQ